MNSNNSKFSYIGELLNEIGDFVGQLKYYNHLRVKAKLNGNRFPKFPTKFIYYSNSEIQEKINSAERNFIKDVLELKIENLIYLESAIDKLKIEIAKVESLISECDDDSLNVSKIFLEKAITNVNCISKLLLLNKSGKEKEQKLTLKQIALKYHYEGKQITRKNSSEIVNKFGYTSGDKLYQYFTFFSSTANRKGHPGTLKKLENKINQLQFVIEILEPEFQDKAKDELKALQSYSE